MIELLHGSDDLATPPDPPDAPMPRAALLGFIALIALVALLVAVPTRTDSGPDADVAPAPPSTTSSVVPTTTTLVGEPDALEEATTGISFSGESRFTPTNVGELEFGAWIGGDTRIKHLDLDDGVRTQFDVYGFPLVAVDNNLVYRDRLERRFRILDLTNPAAAPTELPDLGDFVPTALAESAVDGALWLADERADGTKWILLSLESGSPLRATETESLDVVQIADSVQLALGPEIDQRAGHVWRLTPTGHERWFVGRVMARDSHIALVERCEPKCQTEWRLIETGEVLPRLPPDELLDETELLGAGLWMYSRSDDLLESYFLNTVSADIIDPNIRRSTRPFDIDRSGSWALMAGSQRLWLLDLGSGAEIPISAANTMVGVSTAVVLDP